MLDKSSYELFKTLLGKSDFEVAELIAKSSCFLSPDVVRQKLVMFPDCVRQSNQHHPSKKKGDKSTWNQMTVSVCDNTTARLAFGRYANLKMGGKNRTLPKGWNVAHIWGQVYDPDCFTAGWSG